MNKKKGLKDEVLEFIKSEKSVTKTDISNYFKLSAAGTGKIVKELLLENLIVKAKQGISTGGRPPVILEINKENLGKVLGVYYAPTFIEITLGNISGDMYESYRYEIETKGEVIFTKGEELIQEMLNEYSDIGIISVVVNGLIDSKNGIVIFSPHYNVKNFNLKSRLEEKFNLRVLVENDVRAMALTEKIFGLCKENHNFVVLNIEEGVGGSIYLNDMLYHGYGSMSGELGHMVVKRESFEICSCGKKGCLETEVSNRALIKKIFKQIRINGRYSSLKKILENRDIAIDDVITAYDDKDMLVLAVIGEAIQYVTYAIDMIISVINPEKIILYGDIFKSKNILDGLLKDISKLTMDEQNYEINVSNFLTSIYKKAPFSLANYMIFKY